MKQLLVGSLRAIGRVAHSTLVAIITVLFIGGGIAALANYTATQGTGTTFASVVISTVHYAAMLICDATAGQSQCATVKAGNTAATTDVALEVADANVLGAVTSSIPAGTNSIGAVTIANGGNTAQGSTTDTPCTLPATGTACTGQAVLKAIANAVNSSDPCLNAAKTDFAIGSASGNIQIVGGVSTKKVYLCSLSLIAAAAAVVNVIEGTGGACTTANEAAVIGSTTAASGMSLAANGGLTLGNGGGTVAVTATAANGICILQSGTVALAGNATYVQQ